MSKRETEFANNAKKYKYVYLFELDSVRKTDEEIKKGQKKLFDEIVYNGNVVVLTYNQIVDSRGFFSLFNNEDYYNNFIALCERGFIKISQYNTTRSISQYIFKAIDKNLEEDKNEFIFKALPIKGNQRKLLELVKKSLENSDLTELSEYTEDGGSDEELRKKLNEKLKKLFEENGNISSKLDISQMRDIIENLRRMISLIIRLSAIDGVYIKAKPPESYKDYKLMNYLDTVMKYDNDLSTYGIDESLWKKSVNIIRKMECYKEENNDRSDYWKELKTMNSNECLREEYYFAAAIISACYNFACEMSIRDISKHYSNMQSQEFKNIFLSRLSEDWNNGKEKEKRYSYEDINKYDVFKDYKKVITDFAAAVRITEYVGDNSKKY